MSTGGTGIRMGFADYSGAFYFIAPVAQNASFSECDVIDAGCGDAWTRNVINPHDLKVIGRLYLSTVSFFFLDIPDPTARDGDVLDISMLGKRRHIPPVGRIRSLALIFGRAVRSLPNPGQTTYCLQH